MDDQALRAMMPMSFGRSKKPASTAAAAGTKRPAPSSPPPISRNQHPAQPTSNAAAAAASAITAHDDQVDENGLTPADRALNAELDRQQQAAHSSRDQEDNDNDSDNDSDDDQQRFAPSLARPDIVLPPMSHEAVLKGHTKTLSALALDPGGSRIATGAFDYDLNLWDFGGMDSSLRPFRHFEPAGSYPINDLAFSPHAGGELLVCISATAMAKVFDREGTEVGTCKKGDPYLRDMRQTKGHISELSAGAWDPIERGRFMTASSDSTVRFWHVDDMNVGQRDTIVLKSRERGTRTKVTAASYGQEGTVLAAAGLDGALHWWDLRGNLASKPRGTVERAHESGRGISCVQFSRDGNTLATRGGDETVKLWDRRMFRAPVVTRGGLPSSAMTDVIFSLDEKSLLTGVSAVPLADGNGPGRKSQARRREIDDDEPATKETTTGGSICVLSLPNLDEVQRYSVSPSSVLRLRWHPRLNQLFASTRSGGLHVFYSSTHSTNGALLSMGRKPRERNPFNVDLSPVTISSDAAFDGVAGATMPQSNASKRRRMEKMRADPVASRMPQRPMEGKGKGGRVGASATQHVVQNLYRDVDTRSQDPREALLKYAEEAERNPLYTKIYSQTQPKVLYAQVDEEDEKEDAK